MESFSMVPTVDKYARFAELFFGKTQHQRSQMLNIFSPVKYKLKFHIDESVACRKILLFRLSAPERVDF